MDEATGTRRPAASPPLSSAGPWHWWSGLAGKRPAALMIVIVTTTCGLAYFGLSVTDNLSSGATALTDPGSESTDARMRIERLTGARPEADLLAIVSGSRPDLESVVRTVRSDPGVAFTATRHLAADRGGAEQAVLAITLKAGSDDQVRAAAARLARDLSGRAGARVSGTSVVEAAMIDQIMADLRTAEVVVFPLLFLLSLWIFRSLVAAVLPLVVGGAAIVVTFAALTMVDGVLTLSAFITNLVTALTLGLAIDFSLLFVNRFREELANTGDARPALDATMATAGRTIAFSSLTVSAAMVSLLVFPQQYVYSMGVGGVLAPMAAAGCALVILPTVLILLGHRVNALAPGRLRRLAGEDARAHTAGFWYGLARQVMRWPVPLTVTASVVLLLVGLPALGMRVTGFTTDQLPGDSPARRTLEEIGRALPETAFAHVYVVVDAAAEQAPSVTGYARSLSGLAGAAKVMPPRYLGGQAWRIDVLSNQDELSGAARRLVGDIRALPAPVPVQVGGMTAAFVDELSALRRGLPPAFLLAFVLTLLTLLAYTRAVVLPIKCLVTSLLTMATTAGALVVTFQWLGLSQPPGAAAAIEASTLILTLTVVFGLSTDYGVMMLSRIMEGHERGLPDDVAIARGLERTGRLVTSAALLFAVAVGAFALSRLVYIDQLAVGAVTAVLVDTTIVRAVLVPALMCLLGSANWWAPRLLRRRGGAANPIT